MAGLRDNRSDVLFVERFEVFGSFSEKDHAPIFVPDPAIWKVLVKTLFL
jgi:hypothetical protein